MADAYTKYPHYVPIVKWQSWERRGLKEITATVAARVMPCVEVRDSAQHASMVAEFAATWPHPGLVDYSNPQGQLTSVRLGELQQFLKLAKGSAAFASPVLGISSVASAFPAISKYLAGRPVTLRSRLQDLANTADQLSLIAKALETPGLSAAANRLILDLGPTPAVSPAQLKVLSDALGKIRALGFQHLHLASGAFPESLQAIEGAGEVPRKDWQLWERVAADKPTTLVGFADYGPLTPTWTEETLTRRGGRSILRYTLEDKWRIIRATSNKTSDSIAISELMVNLYSGEFRKRPFSFGDALIADRADPTVPLKDKKCGHYHIAEFWNHHITFVVKEQY